MKKGNKKRPELLSLCHSPESIHLWGILILLMLENLFAWWKVKRVLFFFYSTYITFFYPPPMGRKLLIPIETFITLIPPQKKERVKQKEREVKKEKSLRFTTSNVLNILFYTTSFIFYFSFTLTLHCAFWKPFFKHSWGKS